MYTSMHAYDCITRRAVFHNVDQRPLMRKKAMSGGPGSAAGHPLAASCSFRRPTGATDDNAAVSMERDFCDYDHGGGGCRPPPQTATTDQQADLDIVEDCYSSESTSAENSEYGVSPMTSPRNTLRSSCNSRVRYGTTKASKECYKIVTRAMSMTLDIMQSAEPTYLTQLSGSWGRERHRTEIRLAQGMHSFGSRRGVSSHQSNPFCAISDGPPHEQHGEVRGFALAYSGNFLIEAETDEMRRTRINVGVHPSTTQWHLGEWSLQHTRGRAMRSSEGLGGMSRVFHRLINERLRPSSWADSALQSF